MKNETKAFWKDVAITIPATFIAAVVVTYVYNLVAHGAGRVDWDAVVNLTIVLAFVLPFTRMLNGKKDGGLPAGTERNSGRTEKHGRLVVIDIWFCMREMQNDSKSFRDSKYGEISFMQSNPVQITRNITKSIEPFETADTIDLSKEESKLLDSIADLLEYPTEAWFQIFDRCKDLILVSDRPETEYFSDFCLEIRPLSLLELQELYTRTFDLSPVCALEIGYHLFGEDYKRGEFLARLRESQNEYQLGQEKQLPDFLPVMLRLLWQFDDSEERAAMIGYCLIPGLTRMIEAFDKKQNPYGNVIRYLCAFLTHFAERSMQDTEQIIEARYEYA